MSGNASITITDGTDTVVLTREALLYAAGGISVQQRQQAVKIISGGYFISSQLPYWSDMLFELTGSVSLEQWSLLQRWVTTLVTLTFVDDIDGKTFTGKILANIEAPFDQRVFAYQQQVDSQSTGYHRGFIAQVVPDENLPTRWNFSEDPLTFPFVANSC